MTATPPAAVRQSAESFEGPEIIGGKHEPRARALEAAYETAANKLRAALDDIQDALFISDHCDYAKAEQGAKSLVKLIRNYRDTGKRFNSFIERPLVERDS